MRNQTIIRTELLRGRALLRVGYPPLLAPFLSRTVLAITLGRRIWIHPSVLEEAPATLDCLLRHELVHVDQYRRDGLVQFLVRYAWEYLRGRQAGKSHYDAYRDISYEREAWGDAAAPQRDAGGRV